MKDLQGSIKENEMTEIIEGRVYSGVYYTIRTDGKGNYGVFGNNDLYRNHTKSLLGDMALDSAKGHFMNLTNQIKM